MGRAQEKFAPLQLFESLIWGVFSRVPFGQPSYLPGSESVFGLSQGPPPRVFSSWPKMDSSQEAYG